jgi:hypothetical protein
VRHGLAQVLGAGLAALAAPGDLPRGAAALNDVWGYFC